MASQATLPDTCPVPASLQTQGPSQPPSQPLSPWGYLFPNQPKVRWLVCLSSEYIVGRAPQCDLILGEELDPKLRCQFSKHHFRLRRAQISANSDLKVVHIDDLSSNGTFINRKKIGQGRSAVLRNHDKISLALPSYDAFVYMDKEPDGDVRGYPVTVLDKYAISHKLGSGSFGEVRRVFDKSSGEAYAMKVIKKNRFTLKDQPVAESKKVVREISILKRLRHNFVIKFHDVLDYPDTVFLVVELVNGGELFNKVKEKPLKEIECKYYFHQLALAVLYLHRQGIIHRDIKLENILLTADPDPMIKLADFGLSNFIDSESLLKTICGTPIYMAPEILASEGREGSYNKQADIWSMGVVLYMCLSGISPFSADDSKLPLKRQILLGYYSFPRKYWRYISQSAQNLIRRMLVVNPARRITIEEIINHPWLRNPEVTSRVLRLLRDPRNGKENVIDDDEQESPCKRARLDEYDTSSLES